MLSNHALRNVVSEHRAHCCPPGISVAPAKRPRQHVATKWLSTPVLRRWLLGALMHALLYIVFRFPDVDLALSYAILGSDHGALLVLGRTYRVPDPLSVQQTTRFYVLMSLLPRGGTVATMLCVMGAALRDDLMVRHTRHTPSMQVPLFC